MEIYIRSNINCLYYNLNLWVFFSFLIVTECEEQLPTISHEINLHTLKDQYASRITSW